MTDRPGPPAGWRRGESPDDPDPSELDDDLPGDQLAGGSSSFAPSPPAFPNPPAPAPGWPDAAGPTLPWQQGGWPAPSGPPWGAGVPGPPPAPRRHSRLPLVLAALVVVLLVAGGGVYLLTRRDSGPSASPSRSGTPSPTVVPEQALSMLCTILKSVAASSVPAIETQDDPEPQSESGGANAYCELETASGSDDDQNGSVSASVSVYSNGEGRTDAASRCRDEATREAFGVSYLKRVGTAAVFAGSDPTTSTRIGQVVMCSGRVQVNLTYYLVYAVNQTPVLDDPVLVSRAVSLGRTLATRLGG